MFCTSQPIKPQPKGRPRRVKTRAEMVDAVRDLIKENDCVQKDDLKRAGFSNAEIETHGESVIAEAHKARRTLSTDA